MRQRQLSRLRVIALVFAACLLGVLGAGVRAFAAETPSTTVRLGYYEARNFSEGAQDGDAKRGYAYEYLQHVAAYAGWRYEYVYGTWDELYAKLAAGEIDLLPGVSQIDEHVGQVLFPQDEMLDETFYIYTAADDAEGLRGHPEALSGKRVGVVASANSSPVFAAWAAASGVDIETVAFDEYDALYGAFEQGSIDAFVSSDNVAYKNKDAVPVEIVGTEPYYLAVAKGREDLLAQLDNAQTVMGTQDRVYLDELRNRYTADSVVNVYLAPDEALWMSTHSTLRVGYLNDYLPYCAQGETGEATGLLVDVLTALLDDLPGGWAPQVETHCYASQSELIEALKAGKVDVAFPVGGETWYAEQQGFRASTPVVSASMEMVCRQGSDPRESFDTVAVNRNNLMQQLYVQDALEDSKIEEFDSIEACLDAVRNGEVGCTVVNGLRASALLKSEPGLYGIQLPEADTRCFATGEDNSVLLRFLNRGLGRLGESYGANAASSYTAGLYKYTTLDYVRDNLPFVVGITMTAIAAVVLLGVRHVRKLRREAAHEAEQNRKLEDALSRAERASRAKDVLLSNLSHDIRTPLNGILGVMDVNGTCDDPREVLENTRKARIASRQLLGMVDDLLEMSKLKSGDVQVDKEVFLLTSVFDTVLAEITPQADDAGVTVRYQCHYAGFDTTWVKGSPVYVRQVFVNVLDNAIRYNRDGGSVIWEVGMAPSGDSAMVLTCAIIDNGSGMAPETLERLFEPFGQMGDAVRSTYAGSGLGLSIAKALVDLMGGTIDAESDLGRGTRIVVTLPFELAHMPVPEPAASVSDGAGTIGGMRVLLAEDNELNAEITRYVLERAGAGEVLWAQDGIKVVEMFKASRPGSIDAVLMDVMMPGMDGIAATRAIRALDRADAATVPIIALTAKAFADDRSEALEAGMNEHLAKPIDSEVLIATLQKYR